LHKVYRLYEDPQSAFICGVIESEDHPGRYDKIQKSRTNKTCPHSYLGIRKYRVQ
jgi:hypothetical protein